jgi:hypothetical protein
LILRSGRSPWRISKQTHSFASTELKPFQGLLYGCSLSAQGLVSEVILFRYSGKLIKTGSKCNNIGRRLDSTHYEQHPQPVNAEDIEIPEQTEGVLEQLFEALQDRVSFPLPLASYSNAFSGYHCSMVCFKGGRTNI